MKKLVTDKFVRRIAQIFLLSLGGIVLVVCGCFIALAIQHRLYGFTVDEGWKYQFIRAVSFPFDSAFGTFVTGLSAVIPAMLASVCFRVVSDGSSLPKAGPDLNEVGHTFIVVLAVGILLAAVSVFLVSTGNWTGVFEDGEVKKASLGQMRAVFGALMAIQGSYLTILIKDKE